MSFNYFQIKNMNVANSSCKKYKRKNGIICLVSMLSYWIMVLKLSTKVHFLEFGADLSQKPKSIKAIYIYTSEVLITVFQKIIWFMGVAATVHEILTI